MLRRFSRAACLAAALIAAPALAEVEIHDAWVRAVPPVSSGTAGYLTLVNASDRAVTLKGATAKFAHHVMLHSMAMDANGLRRMKHEDAIVLAPGESVELAPGGRHLMIMGLSRVPAAGETVELCLQFAVREPLCHGFAVRLAQ